MRSSLLVASLALAVGALGAPASAAADPCCGRHHGCGHHHGCASCPGCVAPDGPRQGPAGQRGAYDPDAVTTLKGKVKAVSVVPARGGRSGGTHVTLESDGAATDVQLGPTWFMEQEGLKLAAGDALEVTGSLLEDDAGKAYLVAREVRKGTTLYRLRDERGTPAWAGGPRRD